MQPAEAGAPVGADLVAFFFFLPYATITNSLW